MATLNFKTPTLKFSLTFPILWKVGNTNTQNFSSIKIFDPVIKKAEQNKSTKNIE